MAVVTSFLLNPSRRTKTTKPPTNHLTQPQHHAFVAVYQKQIMKRKPVVGETLYRLNIGNAAHRCEQKLVQVVVTSVGRKYFKCAPTDPDRSWEELEFHIEDWIEKVSRYSADYCLYKTEQEWLDEKEQRAIASFLREEFSAYGRCNLSLQTLRQIKALIQESSETTEPTP